MPSETVVLDYGLGNVRSVANAVELLGFPVRVSRDPQALSDAGHLILPGVGSFGDGMRRLRALGLNGLLEEQVRRRGKPLLGICLGMQLLAEDGEEGGTTSGLGWVAGRVRKLDAAAQRLKIPHMGWNDVFPAGQSVLYRGVPEGASFYFVHSYRFVAEDPAAVSGTCEYGGVFCASLEQGHIFGTQFHPEKSQRYGLRVLRNFLEFSS